MSDTAIARPVAAAAQGGRTALVAKVAVWAALLTVAVAFVFKYVFRYYLNYNEAAFTDPIRGAANYWLMRRWLLAHMTGGMVALLTGPWQFWTGFRQRHMHIHRWTGRLFLTGVCIGSIGAFRMAVSTTFGWAFGVGLVGLATAWVTTAGMAYYAIRQGHVQTHKEWMIRAYVVTFAFVTFRLMNDYGPTSRLQPDNDRALTLIWLCWAVPLLIAEVVLQLRRMRRPLAR
jgi:uncharacterized membrane protein YozB (DUF420 family)